MGYIRAGDRVEAEGRLAKSAEHLSAGKNIVSPEYFQTMGIPLIRGRIFKSADNAQSPDVAIVNQQFADIVWPGRDPIGQRFRSVGSKGPWIEVVGVTNTGKYESLFEDPQPYFYVPIAQEYTGLRVLQVRSAMASEALAPAIEQAIRAYEPNLPLYDVQPMTQALGSGLGFFPVRAGAFGVAALGLLASALAIVGVYGVVSYLTSQRRHEIGVRMAVGATRHDVGRLVLLDGFRLVVCGLAAGLVLILATSRVVGSLPFGISPRDPLTLLGVAAILGCVSLIACGIPAWRAARVDPTVVLRSE
jgi:predicted permease